MPFTVTIVFTGLIAFVPIKVQGGSEVIIKDPAVSPDYVWALLIDATSVSGDQDQEGKYFENHAAAVRFDVDTYSTPGRPFDQGKLPGTLIPDSTAILWFQKDEVITLELPGAASVLELVTGQRLTDKDRPCCTDTTKPPCGVDDPPERVCHGRTPSAPEQMRDYTWLASLADLQQNADIVLNSAHIFARIKIDRGTLETLTLSGEVPRPQWERYKQATPVKFGTVPAWGEHPITNKVALTVSNVQSTLKLKSPGYADVVLVPSPRCKARECEVLIEVMNTPRSVIENRWQYHQPGNRSRRHFELFWKITDYGGYRHAPSFVYPPPTSDLLCPEVRP